MKKNESAPIICATDFSDSATEAATVAAIMAGKMNAPLKLVYARELMALGATPQSAQIIEKNYRDRLHAESLRLEKLGADVDAVLCEGRNPCDALLEVVNESEARMLVVPWQEVHADWHTYSLAERIAQLSPVPTLVIRKSDPFTFWLKKEQPLKVFVAIDFSLSSDDALRWVKVLQSIGPCQVTAAYVDHPGVEERRLGVSGSLVTAGNVPRVQRILEQDLRDKVCGILGNDDAKIIVRGDWGSESHELLEIALDTGSDLFVVGSHQRHGMNRFMKGSISRKVLHHSTVSIACIPAGSQKSQGSQKIRRFKRVLAAVDLNEVHGFASSHAYSIVEPGGEVLLFHNIVSFEPYARQLPAIDLAALERRLLRLTPEDANEQGIDTRTVVSEEEDTADAICYAAEQFNADAICIGSHTRPGLTAKLFGSVALSVLQKSRRPVLLAWPPSD